MNTMPAAIFDEKTMEILSQGGEPSAPLHVLVVDADPAVRSACAEIASSLGYVVEATGDMGQARSLMRGHAADIVLVNLPNGNGHGLELVSEVKLLYPQTALIAMTVSMSVASAVEAMRCGAVGLLDQAVCHGRTFERAGPRGGHSADRYGHAPAAGTAETLPGAGRHDRPLR